MTDTAAIVPWNAPAEATPGPEATAPCAKQPCGKKVRPRRQRRGRGRRAVPKLRGDLVAPRLELPTFSRARLMSVIHSGRWGASAVELALGDLLSALLVGDRLISLGFSCLKDYTENILGMGERTAQAAVQLSRALSTRPILRAAVHAGELTPRKALTVLRVAKGEAEAAWTERAKHLTVRALLAAVRAELASRPGALPGSDMADEIAAQADEPLRLFQVQTPSPEDRAELDRALERAAQITGSNSRALQLLALAQEYLGGHPLDDAGEQLAAELAAERDARERREREAAVEERLENETANWVYLERPRPVEAPDLGLADLGMADLVSAEDLDAQLCALAYERVAWDDLVGYCANVVKQTGLHTLAGFASWKQYSKERLGLSPRVVEQRAALERRLWQVSALKDARDLGLAYSKLLVLSSLPDTEIPAMAQRARKLTVVELREAVAGKVDAHMCAAGVFRAWLPWDIQLALQQAFVAACRTEGPARDDGESLVRLARHFNEVWKDAIPAPKTVGQHVRARDGRCQVPGCSRPASHSHHVEYRSRGGSNSRTNQVGDCPPHHLRGIHGGYITVTGTAPDHLTWTVGGRVWKDAEFGRGHDDERDDHDPVEE